MREFGVCLVWWEKNVQEKEVREKREVRGMRERTDWIHSILNYKIMRVEDYTNNEILMSSKANQETYDWFSFSHFCGSRHLKENLIKGRMYVMCVECGMELVRYLLFKLYTLAIARDMEICMCVPTQASNFSNTLVSPVPFSSPVFVYYCKNSPLSKSTKYMDK